ncbi:MAG: hypothetical protein GY913_01550 [Proteobacteria bacterium]|nr:hypothetical protein [Pseudomonadota bacterium]MCP4915584.1 hypothetical protein [Pseudomonadota bacterium]
MLTAVGSGDPNGVVLVGLMWGVILAIPAFIGLVVGLRKVVKHKELSLASRRVLDVSSATGKLRIRQPNAMVKFIALERVEDAEVETLLAKVPPRS